jgi:hypothetical protein
MPPKRTMPLAEHFWLKVDRSGDCWLWQAAKRPAGYGTYYVDRVPMLAHRVAWELTYGPIPHRLFVCHSCDVPSCVRPEHLFLGSARANAMDAGRKGRLVAGERRPVAKLTAASVRAIRERYASGGVSQQDLATEYGVTQSIVWRVIRGKAWRHVA